MGNFFSQRAICGKTKSFPDRIIRWTSAKSKKIKKVFTSTDDLFSTKNIGEEQKKSLRLPMTCFPPKLAVKSKKKIFTSSGGLFVFP